MCVRTQIPHITFPSPFVYTSFPLRPQEIPQRSAVFEQLDLIATSPATNDWLVQDDCTSKRKCYTVIHIFVILVAKLYVCMTPATFLLNQIDCIYKI